MKNYLQIKLVFLVVLGFQTGNAQTSEPPRSYVAFQTDQDIQIDGEDKEQAWKVAPYSEKFIDIEGVKKPEFQTRMKMLWDKKFLYFFAEMEEPHVWANLVKRDTIIFYNNDFEIFIDPDGDTHNYYEFEMNALNTVWDLFLVKPYREGSPVVDSWDITGLKSAVSVQGTLNNPTDKDRGWKVEVAIPWEVLLEAAPGNKIPKEDFWRINFSRVNWEHVVENNRYSRKRDEDGELFPEYNWVWSPQGVINMHEPEHWGYVYFSPEKPGANVDFEIPKEERIRWYLYDLYRKQKAYKTRTGAWATSIQELDPEPLVLNELVYVPKLETHQTGWNIILNSDSLEDSFLIREDGDYSVIKNE